MRAPDHAQLKPFRFLKIAGNARETLGSLFARARLTADPSISSGDLEKTKVKPLRAPLILVAVARIVEHPKVPEIEQLLATGAAVQNILLAAYAQGLGAIWRTGSMAYNQIVNEGLDLAPDERVVGFVYLGEVEGNARKPNQLPVQDFVRDWTGR